MKKTILWIPRVLGVVLGLTLTTFAVADGLGVSDRIETATQRRYAGVITAVDASSVTIQAKTAVTARVVAGTTRVVIDGNVVRPADLRATMNAKAELGLDDVWASIVVSTK